MNKRLYLILGLAFILRAWGIWFGPYHPDEHLVINQALSFGAGNPFSFIYYYYPPFFHYILFLAYAVFFIIGWILGPFRNFDNFYFLIFIKQVPFYIIGRFLTALIGTATVIPVYIIVKKIRSENAALLAALFMSCMYFHVMDSHYCTVDIPMTFMVILSYVYILKIVQNDEVKNYILAGIMIGLAMATKYNALILLPCLVIASPRNIRNMILGVLCAVIVFSIFCSYYIWDYHHFAKDMGVLYSATTRIGKNVSLWYRFSVNLYHGMGWPSELFGILGFLYLIFKEKKIGIILAAFPFLYFLMLIKGGQAYSRYVLPVAPFFAISAGLFSYDLLTKITPKFKKVSVCFIITAIIILPLVKSFYMDYLLSKPDVRDLAKDWIYKNIPPGSKIAVDRMQYSPVLFATKDQLKQKLEDLASGRGDSLKKKRLKLMLSLKKYPQENYELYYLSKKSSAEFWLHTPVISYNEESILDNGVEYIVTNDLSYRGNKDFYDSLRGRAVLINEFSPFKEKVNARYSRYLYSYIPIDDTIFKMSNIGVGIKIFKIEGKE